MHDHGGVQKFLGVICWATFIYLDIIDSLYNHLEVLFNTPSREQMVFSSNNILDVNDSNKHKFPLLLNAFKKDLLGFSNSTCLLGTCNTMYNECFVWSISRFWQQMGLHPLQMIIMVHGLLLSKIVINLTHDYARVSMSMDSSSPFFE
jgi:hypothetical protein